MLLCYRYLTFVLGTFPSYSGRMASTGFGKQPTQSFANPKLLTLPRNGLNWRAFVAYTLGMFPALPGFIAEVQPSIHVSDTWRRFFQISFFFGYIVSGTIHYLLNKYFPPPGLGEQVNFEIDQGVIEVMDSSSEHGPEYLKTAEATETKV